MSQKSETHFPQTNPPASVLCPRHVTVPRIRDLGIRRIGHRCHPNIPPCPPPKPLDIIVMVVLGAENSFPLWTRFLALPTVNCEPHFNLSAIFKPLHNLSFITIP